MGLPYNVLLRALLTTGGGPTLPWTPLSMGTLGGYFDSRDLANGAVSSWTSRDPIGQLSVQATAANQPVKSASGVTWDGSNDVTTRGTTASKLTSTRTLPDGGSNSTPGKGWTVTGLARAADGTWWIGNHGQARPADIGTVAWGASIIRVSADFTTILQQITMADKYPGFTSIQGISCDGLDGSLWFTSVGTGKVYHMTAAGVDIPADTLTPSWIPSGIAIDSVNRKLWISQQDSAGDGLQCLSIAAGTYGNVLVTSVSTSVSNQDSMHFDDASGLLLLSYGANGSPGNIKVYNTLGISGNPQPIATINGLTTSEAIEGVFLDGNKLWVMNDGWYHNDTINQVMTYDITWPQSHVVEMWGVVTVPTTTGTDCLMVIGDPLASSGGGFGIFTTGNTDLRMIVQNAGSTTRATGIGTTTSLTTPRIFWAQANNLTKQISLAIDGGTAAVTATSQLGTPPFSNGLQMWFGNSSDAVRYASFTSPALGYNIGAGDRSRIEGYLAWTFGLTANLPSGHPYKNAAP